MSKIMLDAAEIRMSYGERCLLKIDQLRIYDTDRIGLIGENGAGKTTLLRILAGETPPESGTVRRFVPTAVIHQEGTGNPGEDQGLRARFRVQADSGSLSGGEMTRNRISGALSSHPEMLMADEPTTDLDQEGLMLLRKALTEFQGAILLISHDRAEESMDAAACVGCGACVATCKNGSAMLFVAARVSSLALLPQGRPEAKRRAKAMVAKMDELGFGNCTNTRACELECPKGISVSHIARLNREFLKAKFSE